MPLEIHMFRKDQGGDPDAIRQSQIQRFKDPKLVDKIIEYDNLCRNAVKQFKELKTEENKKSVGYANIIKQSKKEKRELNDDEKKQLEVLKSEKEEIEKTRKEIEESQTLLMKERERLIYLIGNIVHNSVPISMDEKDNDIIKKWGDLRLEKDQNYPLRHHHELLYMVDGYDPDRGVKICGHRGYFLTGPGVLLNLALQNYGIHFLTNKKYTACYPPFFMDKELMSRTAQLEDFNESLYHVSGESMDNEKYLIATSEQPISAMHYKEWFNAKSLPIKYAGISTNFRKEAGAHGKDAWGIFRVHQFDKIEQFIICEPSQSWQFHEEMIKTAEEFYESLKIPYRVVNIVSGELNNAAAKKYDLEGWFPTLQNYRELVSASNCTDYQSVAMEIRYGYPTNTNPNAKNAKNNKNNDNKQQQQQQQKKEYVHMLNATLCATTRTICAILENYQTEKGIEVPKVLVPYMHGMEFIPFTKEPPINKDQQKKNKQKDKKSQKAKPAKNNNNNNNNNNHNDIPK